MAKQYAPHKASPVRVSSLGLFGLMQWPYFKNYLYYFGGFLIIRRRRIIIIYYNGPQNPILIIKAPIYYCVWLPVRPGKSQAHLLASSEICKLLKFVIYACNEGSQHDYA